MEALACGTPVAACDVPAVREVLDGRALLSDVGDLEGLIAAAQATRRPAPPPLRWRWSDAAAATWAVYDEAASAPAGWRGSRRRLSSAARTKRKG